MLAIHSFASGLVEIRQLGIAWHIREIYAFLTFFVKYFLRQVYRLNGSTDFDD
jgi:hypothetical protein